MKNQFETLQPWLAEILYTLKREIKTEHLSKGPSFYKNYFGNRPLNRLTTEEIVAAYAKELVQGNEDLGEWIVNRWVFSHGEIYNHFVERLEKIDAQFNEIQALDESQSNQVLEGAIESFGALPTYLFSVLNGVVFPESVFQRLRLAAEKEDRAVKEEQATAASQESLEQMKARYERDIGRLKEKCEDKIAGVMKKYTTEIEALKKQIRALQQRLPS